MLILAVVLAAGTAGYLWWRLICGTTRPVQSAVELQEDRRGGTLGPMSQRSLPFDRC